MSKMYSSYWIETYLFNTESNVPGEVSDASLGEIFLCAAALPHAGSRLDPFTTIQEGNLQGDVEWYRVDMTP